MRSGLLKLMLVIFALGVMALVPAPDTRECPVSFIEKSMIDTSSIYAPFAFFSFGQFEFDFLEQDQQNNHNIDEWLSRFPDCGVERGDVFQVIYRTTIEEFEEWRAATINHNLLLPIDLRNNTFAEAIQNAGCTEIIDYLLFAKKCEPLVTQKKNHWERQDIDLDAYRELMKEGAALFRKTESHFIRLRIAYQVIRLAHYAGEYNKVLKLRDYFLPKVDKRVKSIIHWWILAHVAGAEYRLGQKPEAAYHFAQVFQNCPSKRKQAFESFRIENDKQWKEALLLCKSNDERANLYAIRAANERSRLIDEMEAIYRLNPQHPALEPLLLRKVKQLEAIYLPQNLGEKNLPPSARKEMKRTKKFIQKVLRQQQVKHPVLWEMAYAYLLLLEGNWPEAEMKFNAIKVSDPKLARQLELFKLLAEINSFEEVSGASKSEAITNMESKVYNIMTGSKLYKTNPKLRRYIKDRMAYLYELDSMPGKAVLIKYGQKVLKFAHDYRILDDIVNITEKEYPTRLEKMLTTKPDGKSIRNDVLDIKATLLLSNGLVEAAKETYSLIPRAERPKKAYSPFGEMRTECISCPGTDTVSYPKDELIDKLIEYDYRARADMEAGPAYFLRLGHAWYNMSYYGRSWEVMDYYRDGANWCYAKDDIYPYAGSPFGNKENHDLTKAKYYFSKALELAKDKETQAKACFELARIDQKEWFWEPGCPYKPPRQDIPKLPPRRMTYYNILFREYRDTEFYEEIVEQCKYLDFYSK